MAVNTEIRDDRIQIGEERQVFGALMTIHAYAAASDGQKFLFLLRNPKLAAQPMTVVENWGVILKK